MALLRTGSLPAAASSAAAHFHAEVLPRALSALAAKPEQLIIVFPSADYTHRGWRLAAIQALAREHAPVRVNGLASDEELAIAAACAYLEQAEGVTGQLLALDGHGAGKVITETA